MSDDSAIMLSESGPREAAMVPSESAPTTERFPGWLHAAEKISVMMPGDFISDVQWREWTHLDGEDLRFAVLAAAKWLRVEHNMILVRSHWTDADSGYRIATESEKVTWYQRRQQTKATRALARAHIVAQRCNPNLLTEEERRERAHAMRVTGVRLAVEHEQRRKEQQRKMQAARQLMLAAAKQG